MTENAQPTGISRRTVTKAMAWAAPTIAVAATVPITSASCIPWPVVADGSCKKADQNSYKLFFTVGGKNCTGGFECTGTITRIWEATGQKRTLWEGSAAADGETPIIVCNTPNMANNLNVDAKLDCVGDGGVKTYLVNMPNFNSANNQCADSNFC